MTRIQFLAAVAVMMLLTNCVFRNQLLNSRTDSPHADLVGHGVTIMHINEQPTSFWRCRELFLIPPGLTTLRAFSKTRNGYQNHYPAIQFVAMTGQTYSLHCERTRSADILILRDNGGKTLAQEEAKQKSGKRH